MNSAKLKKMMLAKHGSIKDFAAAIDSPYTTLYNATRGDQQVGNMNVSLFIKVAKELGYTVEELVIELRK